MVAHKLSFDSMMAGTPVVLPYELTISLVPGFGEYATDPGKSGSGVTVRIGRTGEPARTEHYPNRYQAWARVRAIQARHMGGVAS